MYILLVEPEISQCLKLSRYLQQARYLVDSVPTYAAALGKLGQHNYDFVLLAQELPDGNGLDLLREAGLNINQMASFIILTASTANEICLRSFDLGADDCLPKTVALPELERRMQAIQRRRYGLKGPKISFGMGFVLDAAARTLYYGPRAVPLSRKQFDLLHFMLLHRGQPLTRQQLGGHLWGDNAANQRASNYIDVHIKNVRKALASFASPDFLETVHSIGYRMAAA